MSLIVDLRLLDRNLESRRDILDCGTVFRDRDEPRLVMWQATGCGCGDSRSPRTTGLFCFAMLRCWFAIRDRGTRGMEIICVHQLITEMRSSNQMYRAGALGVFGVFGVLGKGENSCHRAA